MKRALKFSRMKRDAKRVSEKPLMRHVSALLFKKKGGSAFICVSVGCLFPAFSDYEGCCDGYCGDYGGGDGGDGVDV